MMILLQWWRWLSVVFKQPVVGVAVLVVRTLLGLSASGWRGRRQWRRRRLPCYGIGGGRFPGGFHQRWRRQIFNLLASTNMLLLNNRLLCWQCRRRRWRRLRERHTRE